MHRVTFFTKEDCELCRAAWFVIQRVRAAAPFETEIVDITRPQHRRWQEAYRNDIPVVHLNGREIFRHRVDEARLRAILAKEPGTGRLGQ